MKNVVLNLSFLLFSCFGIYAQAKVNHLDAGKIQTNLSDLKSFVNERYVVLYGISQTKPGEYQRKVTLTELKSGRSTEINFEPKNKVNATLLGMHLTPLSFEIFEEIYSEKDKKYSIVRHTLYPENQRFLEDKIFESTFEQKPSKALLSSSPNGESSAIYLYHEDKKGFQKATVLFIGLKQTEVKSKEFIFKEKINSNYDIHFQINDNFQFIATHEIINAKDGNYIVLHTESIQEDRANTANMVTLFKDKSLKLNTFKVYLTEDSMIEFMALVEKQSERTVENQFVLRKFHPEKESFIYNTVVPCNVSGKVKLESYLPIDEFRSVVVLDVQEKQVQKQTNEQSPGGISLSNPQAQPNNKSPNIEMGLVIFCIHHNKGVLWQKNHIAEKQEVRADKARMNAAALETYFWSDGTHLFSFFHRSEQRVVEQRGQISANPVTQTTMRPYIRMTHLENRSEKDQPVLTDERMQSLYMLPKYTKATSVEYLISIFQLNPTLFYPVQLYTNF